MERRDFCRTLPPERAGWRGPSLHHVRQTHWELLSSDVLMKLDPFSAFSFVELLQECVASPVGGFCAGKLRRPIPLQGGPLVPAGEWSRTEFHVVFVAGHTFGGLSTPGNGSTDTVLPIVECHSMQACAGGETSFQCFPGYVDTRCACNVFRPARLQGRCLLHASRLLKGISQHHSRARLQVRQVR